LAGSAPIADESHGKGHGRECELTQEVTVRKAAPTSRLATAADGEVRIGPVAAIPVLLSKFGIAPGLPFARAGVQLETFQDPENRIAFEALGRLLAECSTATACDHFGLLVGECFELDGLGAIGDLMRNSTTVGEALRALLLHLYLHDRGAVPILIHLDASYVLLGYSIYRHGTPGAAHLYDVAIAVGYRVLKAICGAAWRPAHVQFSHVRPKDARPFRRLFGPQVRFDAEVSGIVFAASWLDHAIPGADPELRERLTLAIQRAGAHSTMGFADLVQGALHQMVLSGTSSAENVALLFGIHERTLRKRLSADGTSLQRLVSQTRFELAKQLLENTRLPMSDIASALHFADAAVLSRAFRSWSKSSPKEWRARLDRKAAPRADEVGEGMLQRPVGSEHDDGRTRP
jgi:AraC-like DNA-binding protein